MACSLRGGGKQGESPAQEKEVAIQTRPQNHEASLEGGIALRFIVMLCASLISEMLLERPGKALDRKRGVGGGGGGGGGSWERKIEVERRKRARGREREQRRKRRGLCFSLNLVKIACCCITAEGYESGNSMLHHCESGNSMLHHCESGSSMQYAASL